MASCLVLGTILDSAGNAATSVTVSARVLYPQKVGTDIIAPFDISAATDSSGNFSLTVQQSLSVVFTISYPINNSESMKQFTYTGNIPATTSANFEDIIVIE